MKKIDAKRIIAVILFAAMALVSVGCTAPQSGSNETESTKSDTTAESVKDGSENESEPVGGVDTGVESGDGEEEKVEGPVAEGQYLFIDIAKEASSRPLTQEIIQKEMNAYAAAGHKKVWFLIIPDTYAVTESCQGSVVCDPSVTTDHMHRSVHSTLEPNLAYIMAAKNAGLEVIAIYRPYECGGSITIPTTAKAQFSFGERNTIGGKAVFCSAEYGKSDSFYVCSYDVAVGNTTTTPPRTLEMLFAAEEFVNAGATVTPDGEVNITPTLWIGDNNFNYSAAEGVTYTVSEEARTVTDANGNILGQIKCYVLRIDLEDHSDGKYFAVTLENGDKLFTVPFSMINCYDANGEKVTTTKAIFARNPYSDEFLSAERVPDDYFWGSERKPIITTDSLCLETFRAFGFEFQYGGIGADEGDGWHNAYVYGIAVGSKSYLGGNLCEAKESVREYWVGQVDRLYAKGADEVVISLENHGGMVYDYTNYGYNAEIIKAYRDKYGADIPVEEFDYLKLMGVRGAFFLEFIEAAAESAKAWDARLGIELSSSFEDPTLDTSINGLCYYKMPKITLNWRAVIDICDTVVITDRVSGEYNARLAKNIRKYAKDAEKNVIVVAYSDYGADEGFVKDALNDSLNGGVLWIK